MDHPRGGGAERRLRAAPGAPGGIAFELAFTALVVYLPAAHRLLGTAALDVTTLLLIAPFPLVVWGVDELYRATLRRRT